MTPAHLRPSGNVWKIGSVSIGPSSLSEPKVWEGHGSQSVDGSSHEEDVEQWPLGLGLFPSRKMSPCGDYVNTHGQSRIALRRQPVT